MNKNETLKMSAWLTWMTATDDPIVKITKLNFGGLLLRYRGCNIFIDERPDGSGGYYLLLYTRNPDFTMTFFGLCMEDFLQESSFTHSVISTFFDARRIITSEDGRTKE